VDLFVHLHFLLKVSMLRLFFNVEYFSIDFISRNKDVTLFFVQNVGLSIWISSFISFIFNLFSIMPVLKLKISSFLVIAKVLLKSFLIISLYMDHIFLENLQSKSRWLLVSTSLHLEQFGVVVIPYLNIRSAKKKSLFISL
jgi:hypothetical protein